MKNTIRYHRDKMQEIVGEILIAEVKYSTHQEMLEDEKPNIIMKATNVMQEIVEKIPTIIVKATYVMHKIVDELPISIVKATYVMLEIVDEILIHFRERLEMELMII
uniref:Uncharacterized protein n=1 Tax=Cacopsylla melanoneura TaxID=428564 RepID=A0A8D8TJG0_9HEMI